MPNKSFGKETMRELVAAVAGPRQWSDNRKSWFDRAARRAGVSFRQVWAVYYGEITDPEHRTVLRMKTAAGRHEAQSLADRFQHLAGALNQRDADFHSEDINALLHAASALRGLAGPGTDDEEEPE